MSDVERTPAGMQLVNPGCERRTSRWSTTRVDDAGQGLLGFYRPPSLRERLVSRADAPLRPSKGQRAHLPRHEARQRTLYRGRNASKFWQRLPVIR
jgi:hypothetical protein